MANMFREAEKHAIPTSLQDSIKTDEVIKNLWSWSSGIETLGKFLFWAIIVIGVITAITSSIGQEEVAGYYLTRTKTTFDWGMFFLQLLDCALCAFIEYCAYHVIALLVGALASITQNTRATARILEYKETVSDNGVFSNCNPGENEWKCSKCGTINQNYVSTCGCGNTKEGNATDYSNTPETDNTTDQRYCEACGTPISDTAQFCKHCGTKQMSKIYR